MSLTIDEIMTYRLDPYHDSLDLGIVTVKPRLLP